MSRYRDGHGGRRRGLVRLVVAVVLAGLVAGTLLVARRGVPEPDARPGPRGGTAEVLPVSPSPGVRGGSAGPGVVVEWPADLSWVSVAGLRLPVSARFGPHDLSDGRARGFAREPAGALLAAVHLVVRVSMQVGPEVFGPTLREQVVGPDAARYAEAVHDSYRFEQERLLLSWGEPLGRIYASILGVRMDSFGPDAASLRLLIEAPVAAGVVRAATVVQLAWSDGDWRLVAPPRGDWSRVRVVIPAEVATGFTPLPGR